MSNIFEDFESRDYRGFLIRKLLNDFQQCKISLTKVGYRSNIVPSTLYKLNAGLARPGYKTLLAFCAYYIKVFGEQDKIFFNNYYKEHQFEISRSVELAKQFIYYYIE